MSQGQITDTAAICKPRSAFGTTLWLASEPHHHVPNLRSLWSGQQASLPSPMPSYYTNVCSCSKLIHNIDFVDRKASKHLYSYHCQ